MHRRRRVPATATALAGRALLLAAGALLVAPTGGVAATTKSCPRAVVFRDADVTYVAHGWKVAHGIGCRKALHLIQVTYGTGPLKPYKRRYPFPNHSGRPISYVKGGWRCSNGAGGANCWNASRSRYNVIPNGGYQRQAITVTVGG